MVLIFFLCLLRTCRPLGKHYDQCFSFQTQSSGSTTGRPVREIHHGFYQTTQESWQWKQNKKRKEIRQLGNVPWKASFASHDFLCEVFGICTFFGLTRAEKKQTSPSFNPPPQSPKAPDSKKNEWTIQSGGAQMLAKLCFLFVGQLDGVLLTLSVTPGCRQISLWLPLCCTRLVYLNRNPAAAGLMHLAL